MKLCKLSFSVITFCFALLFATSSNAAAINYVFSGTFDGSLGSSTFTNQSFTVTLTGDTGAVTSGGGEFFNTASSANFSIGALTGSLTGNFNEVASNPAYSGGTVIFGQGQAGSPFFVAEGLSTLGSYDLSTAFALASGPVSQTPGSIYFTSLGNLVFNDITSLSFQANLATVPLPVAFPLFAVGLGVMCLVDWRRRTGGGERHSSVVP
jgi:hypothetical protein